MKILVKAIGTLTVIYICFGCVCNLAYGDNTNIIITEVLPLNVYSNILKTLFCVNLVFSYSITIYPTNAIIENWTSNKSNRASQNISRLFVCAAAALIALWMQSRLDKFLGLLGALVCAPLALTVPTLLHLKVCAVTNQQKIVDMGLIILSGLVFVFCTVQAVW